MSASDSSTIEAPPVPPPSHPIAKCVECDGDKPRYKCTACRSPFCSAACNKAHKTKDVCQAIIKQREGGGGGEVGGAKATIEENVGTKQRVAAKRSREEGEEGADNTTQEEGGSSSVLEYALKDLHEGEQDDGGDVSSLQGPLPQGASYIERTDEVYDDDGNIQILGTRQLVALENDEKLRDMLRTRELRSMIKIIDKSRSRLDALEAAMHNSADFNSFCDYLLGVVYRNS